MNEMNDNFDVFDNYAMSYDFNEDMIKYKYNHSYRVMHQADEIAYTLNLNEEESYLACLIGLLHDIGRFEQWKQYMSFDDNKTVDHALYGAKLLFDDGLIKKYKLKKEDYDVVKKSIINHNKLELDKDLSVRETLHSKIVRDADKLDILYAYSNPRILELKNDDSHISEEVKKDFFLHRPVRSINIKNDNDMVILYLSYIFDFNYDYCIETIKEKEYYNKMEEYIKNKEIFKPYFDEVYKFLEGSK